MRQTYRYDRATGRMVGADGLPMLNQAERAAEPKAPMVTLDTMHHVQSQTNGRYYDSKSELRKEYKRAGVIEVGNDVQTKRAAPSLDDKRRLKEARKASVGKAMSQMGFGAP